MRTSFLAAVSLALSARIAVGAPEFKEFPEKDFGSHFSQMYPPKFPDTAAAWHKGGVGWFRLTIDNKTGAVTEIKVLETTGVKALDDSAAFAFLHWKAKPGKIDHAVIKVQFQGGLHSFTGSHIGD